MRNFLPLLFTCAAHVVASATQCRTSHLTAYQAEKGPVTFSPSPLESFESVNLQSINETAWEGWYFDSVSDKATEGATIAFLRDPTFSLFGRGNLYILLYAVWENGTSFNHQDFLDESTIIDCTGGSGTSSHAINGTWRSFDRSYTFSISPDLKDATFTIDTPFMQGTYNIKSTAHPRYADGQFFPSPTGPISLSPNDYWTEGIPAGTVSTNFTINSTPLKFSGFGGHGRHYGTVRLDSIIRYWTFSRGTAGPYSFVLWHVVTKDDDLYDDQQMPGGRISVVVTENGKVVFSSMRMLNSTLLSTSQNENVLFPYVDFTRTFHIPEHENVSHGSFDDQSTGYRLRMIDPGQDRQWEFNVTHRNLAYEMPFFGGDGFGGFVDSVIGGEVGDKSSFSQGIGLTQQNQMASEGLARLFTWSSLKFIGGMLYKIAVHRISSGWSSASLGNTDDL